MGAKTSNSTKDCAMTSETIEIYVDSREALDARLDDAVKGLQQLAMATGTHGILLTRLKAGHYTAALSDQVPFGMTQEIIH